MAGKASSIHHTRRFRNSRPLPFTSDFTIAPSMAATLRLIRVRMTRKKLWLMSSRVSLLRHPGIAMRSSLMSERKNSRFISTLFFFPSVSGPPELDVVPTFSARLAASRAEAAFWLEIAWRARVTRATNMVM